MLTLIKHLLYSKCIEVLFTSINKNILKQKELFLQYDFYSEIIYYGVHYHECVIMNCSEIGDIFALSPSEVDSIAFAFSFEKTSCSGLYNFISDCTYIYKEDMHLVEVVR